MDTTLDLLISVLCKVLQVSSLFEVFFYKIVLEWHKSRVFLIRVCLSMLMCSSGVLVFKSA